MSDKKEVKTEGPTFDIITYCDIKGIHDADRFVLNVWFKNSGEKAVEEWDELAKRLWE